MSDFSEAEIKVIAGPEKKSRVVSEHERKLTAYHEAGHAIVMHALPTHDPVHQITIVPRGGAGGMTISLPTEDRSYQSKRYMEEQIVSLLGGRVAEKLMLGDISTGASNDIQRASQIARKMVTVYGMSERLGSISFESGHDEIFIGRSMAQAKPYSEQVAAQIDEEVKSIVDAAYERCEDILTMQAHGLEKRVRHTNAKTLVIGISGGLDSTLALLVCVEAMKLLGRPASDILAVTMPCFGTTKQRGAALRAARDKAARDRYC